MTPLKPIMIQHLKNPLRYSNIFTKSYKAQMLIWNYFTKAKYYFDTYFLKTQYYF